MAPKLAAAGAFVVSLDSMMNIAFPAMAAAFALPPESVRWIIICYTGVYAIMAFAGGATADVIGHIRVFRLGVALTALAFLAGALAPGFGWLLAARVLQGFAGGLIYGTAPGIVTLAAAPEHRGRALGSFNAALALGLAIGPLLAGALVEAFGWRSVFVARLPLAVAVLAATLALPAVRTLSGSRRLVALADVRRTPVPVACMLVFLAQGAIFAIWLLTPFQLIERRGFDAAVAGAIFSLTPLGTTIAAPLAGRLTDRLGTATPLIAGLALETIGLGALASSGAETPLLVVSAALFAAGFGIGAFQVPMMSLVMGAFPPALQGAAGGLSFLARTLGLVTGVATLAAVFAARRPIVGFDGAFRDAFIVATALVGAATVLAIVRFGRRPLR
jgi:DHA2 family multidrug resistance protein-like MFS transporter